MKARHIRGSNDNVVEFIVPFQPALGTGRALVHTSELARKLIQLYGWCYPRRRAFDGKGLQRNPYLEELYNFFLGPGRYKGPLASPIVTSPSTCNAGLASRTGIRLIAQRTPTVSALIGAFAGNSPDRMRVFEMLISQTLCVHPSPVALPFRRKTVVIAFTSSADHAREGICIQFLASLSISKAVPADAAPRQRTAVTAFTVRNIYVRFYDTHAHRALKQEHDANDHAECVTQKCEAIPPCTKIFFVSNFWRV